MQKYLLWQMGNGGKLGSLASESAGLVAVEAAAVTEDGSAAGTQAQVRVKNPTMGGFPVATVWSCRLHWRSTGAINKVPEG